MPSHSSANKWFSELSKYVKLSRGGEKLCKSPLPEPNVAIGADGLLAVGEGQDLLTQTAVLGEGLFVHLLQDVPNQHLEHTGGTH